MATIPRTHIFCVVLKVFFKVVCFLLAGVVDADVREARFTDGAILADEGFVRDPLSSSFAKKSRAILLAFCLKLSSL